ncbi:MAG: hypothetical protein QOH49_4804, partial [Acidobacteriota bacterium]|nr:hypothetical protein [Acidobacteriota bacterium]
MVKVKSESIVVKEVVENFIGHASQFMLVSIHVIDIELNHRRVHLRGLRETDRAAMQPFQV